MTAEQQALVKELAGERCACGAAKQPRQTFCRNCYYRLPETLRKALYKRLGQGYEWAYRTAREYLKTHAADRA